MILLEFCFIQIRNLLLTFYIIRNHSVKIGYFDNIHDWCVDVFIKTELSPHYRRTYLSRWRGTGLFPQEIDRRVSEAPRITRIAHSVYADTDLTAPNAHTSAARGMQRSASQHPSPTTRFSFARPQITWPSSCGIARTRQSLSRSHERFDRAVYPLGAPPCRDHEAIETSDLLSTRITP